MAKKSFTSSLGIEDDMDGIEIIEDVEAAFQITFADDEIENCVSVDDLFGLIMRQLPATKKEAKQCANVMCFNRLRKVLQPLFPDVQLRPATPISALDSVPVRQIYRKIADDGLRTPIAVVSSLGLAALLLALAGPVVAWLLEAPWWLIAIVPTLAILAYRVAPTSMPEGIETFGDLVKKTAHLNTMLFAEKGARLGAEEAWEALRNILVDYTELSIQEITREKRLVGV